MASWLRQNIRVFHILNIKRRALQAALSNVPLSWYDIIILKAILVLSLYLFWTSFLPVYADLPLTSRSELNSHHYVIGVVNIFTNRYRASGYFRGGPWWPEIEFSELREPELWDPPEPPADCGWRLFPPPVPPASLSTRSHSGPNLIEHVVSAIASVNFS